jgi:hypothetical protein
VKSNFPPSRYTYLKPIYQSLSGRDKIMDAFINTQATQELISQAITGFTIMMVCSVLYALAIIRIIQGRLITFLAITSGMFITFFVLFYGLNFLARYIWQIDQVLGEIRLTVLSFAIAFVAVIFEASCLKILLPEGKSLLAEEFDQLPEDQWTPLDTKRKEHMARYNRK